MEELFGYVIMGNTVGAFLKALSIFTVGTGIAWMCRRYLVARLARWAESTDTQIDDLLVDIVAKSMVPALYFGAFYLAMHSLALSAEFRQGLKISAIVLATVLAVRAATAAVNFGLRSYLEKFSGQERGEKQLRGIRGLINVVIWALALIFLLDNLGVKISAAVAGLGIGGIAVALAAQAVLGDLFSYFVIFFDKPFEVGDFIVIGDKMGVVEHIGIKTTRIRALGGEQLVFSNTSLTNSCVHNFKKMEQRRVVFSLGVVYQTPAGKLKRIPAMVRDIIERQKDSLFDRGHFASYGDFSLNFEFVYYVSGADYNKYMDTQQAINLAIFETFEREGIAFAYPSQTLFVSQAA